jgi:hypothetical protein
MKNRTKLSDGQVVADIHYGKSRLVNKKTGKLASQTNWLLDLAAVAVTQRDVAGIPTLLPQDKAVKLLTHNKLKNFKRHKSSRPPEGRESSHSDLRRLARSALPELAVFYLEKVAHSREATHINRKGFRAWLITELAKPNGILNKHLRCSDRLGQLAELQRGDDWWRISLKTESKFKKNS